MQEGLGDMPGQVEYEKGREHQTMKIKRHLKFRESIGGRKKYITISITFHCSGEEKQLQIQFSKPIRSTGFALLISKHSRPQDLNNYITQATLGVGEANKKRTIVKKNQLV